MRFKIAKFGASETQSKRAEGEIKARVRQQEVVAELGLRAMSGTDLPTLMEEAVAHVAQTLGVEYCKVLELLPNDNALLLRAGLGWKEGHVGHATVGAGTDSQAGYTLLSNEPVIVEDLHTETRFSGPPLLHDHGVISGMSAIIHGKDRPFGVLGAHTTRRRTFGKYDIHFLQAVANILAEAIERNLAAEKLKILHEDLNERNNNLGMLNTITQAVHQSLDLEEVYNVALDTITSMDNVDMTCIYLVDWDRKEAILQAHRNLPEDYINIAGRIPHPKGITWKVINTGELLNIEDIQKDPDTGPAGRNLGHHGVLGLPIRSEGKVIGVIYFASYKERQFNKQEVDLLTSVGNQIAIAVAKVKQTEDLNKRNKDLEIINTITQAVHQSLDLEEVFRIALDKVMDLENIDLACIYLVDEATNEAVVQDHRNFPDDFLRRASRIPYPKGVTWKVINSGEILNVKNAREDPDVGPAGRDLGFRSLLGIPIRLEDKTIGVIWLLGYKEHVFTKPETELLTSIGNQMSVAIAKANLYRELSKKNKYEAIISSVTQSIHQSIDLQEVLENAVEAMNQNIDKGEHLSIYLIEGQELVLKAYRGLSDRYIKKAGRIAFPQGLNWKTVIDSKPIYCPDVDKDSVIGPAGRELGIKSYLSMPIRIAGKTVGVISVGTSQKSAFDGEELKLLEIVAKQIEIAINNARQAEVLKQSEEALKINLTQLSKKNRYAEIISTVTRSVHQSIKLQDVLENAVESMSVNIHGSENVFISLIEGEYAVLKAYKGYPDWFIERVKRIPYPKGTTWKTVIEGNPRYVRDVDQDTVIGPAGREVGTKSYLSMPIHFEGKTVGVININSLQKNAFDEEELKLLEIVANQIEVAINNAKQADTLRISEKVLSENIDRLSKSIRYEKVISSVTKSVHKSINITEVLENAVESMHLNVYGTDNISIYFVEGKDAVMKAYRGYPDWFIKLVGRIPYPKGFTWKTIIEGKPRYVADVDMDDIIGPAGRKVGTKSYLSMPICLEDNVVGVININSLRKHAFSEQDLELLEIVAHQIEVAIDNAKKAEALRESEERYRTLFDQSPVGVYIFDKEFRVTNCNARFVEILNSSYDTIIGVDLRKWKHKCILPLMEKVLQGQSTIYEGYYQATTNSSKLLVYIKLSPLRDNQGNVIGGMAVVEDITERKQLEQALRESQERLAAIFNNTPNVAIEGYDSDGRVLYWNKAAEKIFGWTSEQAIGKTLDQLILDKVLAKEFTTILKKVSETNKPYGPSELKFFNEEGDEGTVYSTIFPLPSSSGKKEFISMDIDITERKRQEEQIRYMAMHDSLTDLPNRRALQETLDRLMKRPKFKNTHALVVMDLDSFKIVNDTLGYLEGDQLLKNLADILRNSMRSNDLLARVGGDEFTMVLKDVTPEKARQIAERFNKAINDYSFYLNGYSFQLSMSIGITMIDSKSDPQMTMAMAYSALSKAKYEGKNRIIVYQYEDKKDFDFDKSTQWLVRIKDALREDRFLLHFQPVIKLDNGEIEYIESFVRMIDNKKKIIFPGAFIPAAEQFGLMSEIDKWVVEEVVRKLNENRKHRLFVNLSGSSLKDTSLLRFIEQLIKDNKGISNKLGFEITEFTRITDLEHVRNWMVRLKDLGCKFALDDFGIGYSSFTYLLALPLDYVKIEGSFVRNFNTDPTSSAIVQSVIKVSHSLGKDVIAECVENESIVKCLRKHKVKFGQGNLWKTPSSDIC